MDTLNIPCYNKTTFNMIFIFGLEPFYTNDVEEQSFKQQQYKYHLQQTAVAESLMEASEGR